MKKKLKSSGDAAAIRIDEFKVMVAAAADGVHTDLQLEVSRSHVWLCYCCCFLFTTVLHRI